MFFDKLSNAQKEEYLRSVVLGEEYENFEIFGISCDAIDEEDVINQMYNLSYLLEDKLCDATSNLREQEVQDFDTNLDHLHFMISKFGIDYLLELKSFSKTSEANKAFSPALLKKCDRFLEQTMIDERKIVGLNKYFDDNAVVADGTSKDYDVVEMERQ